MSAHHWSITTANSGRVRALVVVVALCALLTKLMFAHCTFGSDDVHYWIDFSDGVQRFNYIGIYGKPFPAQYNHPPLTGLLLTGLVHLQDNGYGHIPFLIRVPACVADFATTILLFEWIVRRGGHVLHAGAAAVFVACSPVLITVSGFHGNTDPVFLALALLAAFMVVECDRPIAGGLLFAAALSIKLVAIVVGPVLLAILARRGVRRVGNFVGGVGLVLLVVWGPVVAYAWRAFDDNVLGYSGIWLHQWGLPQFSAWLGMQSLVGLFVGPGRFAVLLISALLPAVFVWKRPRLAAPALGVSLSLFLLLSPAFGMQYLTWPLAASYLINISAGSIYNAAASVFTICVYDAWNNAPPWRWSEAVSAPLHGPQLAFMSSTWAALAVVVAIGLVLLRDRRGLAASSLATGSRPLSGRGSSTLNAEALSVPGTPTLPRGNSFAD